MVLAPLAGIVLIVAASTGPIHDLDPTVSHLSAREKDAAVRPLVERATECIIGRVVSDARYEAKAKAGDLGELIVETVPVCIEPVRTMIAAYDRHFGDGSGEAFFMGPYLDVLPTAIVRRHQQAGAPALQPGEPER